MNHVYDVGKDYAGINCKLPLILRKRLIGNTSRPMLAKDLFEFLIIEVQKINQRNEKACVKPYESSCADLAKVCEFSKTLVYNSLKWLEKNGWLKIERKKGQLKTFYLPDVAKVNKIIAEHQKIIDERRQDN